MGRRNARADSRVLRLHHDDRNEALARAGDSCRASDRRRELERDRERFGQLARRERRVPLHTAHRRVHAEHRSVRIRANDLPMHAILPRRREARVSLDAAASDLDVRGEASSDSFGRMSGDAAGARVRMLGLEPLQLRSPRERRVLGARIRVRWASVGRTIDACPSVTIRFGIAQTRRLT